jgi:DivIVA domain-containing protein
MALTPEDVVNKRFQPTKFREGYDQDEVDDFLDEIVVEFRRITAENDELRQRLQLVELRGGDTGGLPTPAPQVQAFPVPAAPAATNIGEDAHNSNNMLVLARKLHEEHVREGMDKRDQLIAEAHENATRIIAEAEIAAKSQIAKYNVVVGDLETKIAELRTFESEYRRHLRSYIEHQLQELETVSPAAS